MTRSYGRLSLSQDKRSWHLTNLEPHVAIRLKNVFARLNRAAASTITMSNTDAICADLEWFMMRYPLAMRDRDRAQLLAGRDRYEGMRDTAERILLPDWQPSASVAFRDGCGPWPYQSQAIELTRLLGRLLLLDDVGLGKTISALGTIAHQDYLPAAIVVQPHLTEQWFEEYIREFTHLRAHIIKGTKPYTLPPKDLYIFKYSNIAGWVDIAATGLFRSVIFDEIQELRKGEETKKGKAAGVFRDYADVRMGLTATPIYNYGSEIYKVVEYIAPGALGTWYEFLTEWCTSDGNHWVVKNPVALGTYLREQHIVLRRTEEDVGAQMPPVNTLVHMVPFDEEVAAKSEETAHMLALKVVGGTFTERGKAARDLDMLARMVTGVAKARHVAAFVRILLEAGTPVMLTGWHRDVYDIWLKELSAFNPVMYTGSETSARKRKSKQAFISGESNLMIISLRSGAGLDGLQRRCSTVVFGELDWSPQVHKQVIGRLRRRGQGRQVDAIYLATNSGSDPLVMSVLGLKASQSKGILDPLAGTEHVYSDESRIRRLAEMYLARRGTA